MNIYSIYKIENKINGKVYIGYTSQHPAINRFKQHIKQRKNSKSKIGNALKKYGPECFAFEVIFQSKDMNYCKNGMESYFIKQYDSIKNGYNCTTGGEGGDWRVGKTPKQIKEINKKKIRRGKQNGFYGKKHTKETKLKAVESRRKSDGYKNDHSKIKIKYDGIVYESKRDFHNKTGIMRYALNTLLNKGHAKIIS